MPKLHPLPQLLANPLRLDTLNRPQLLTDLGRNMSIQDIVRLRRRKSLEKFDQLGGWISV